MVAAAQHPNITIASYAEVERVEGFIGNFKVIIRKKARSVDENKCTGCGICWEACPSRNITSEFDEGMGKRKAIYLPFKQAVPAVPVIDREHCRYFQSGKCGICRKKCPSGAIDFKQEDEIIEKEFGAIVIATGYELFDWASVYGEYGYGQIPDVITSMQFERMNNASGPTEGEILRPSDGKRPRNIAIITCVGSRDDAKGRSYCSRVCCMYTAKHAHQILEKIPDAQVFVFYMDIRAPGKNYEEFYRRSVEEGAVYIRGRVSRIYRRGELMVVKGEDTLLGRQVEVEADLVILATAIVPSTGFQKISELTGITADKDGFFQEAHPKLRPVETNTAGVFLAGACQGPKDIPDTVAQAGSAAAKVTALFSKGEIETDPMIAEVNKANCSGCGLCLQVCPYDAITLKATKERVAGVERERNVAEVNAGLCRGCGACTTACPSGTINLKGFTNEQILSEVDAGCLGN